MFNLTQNIVGRCAYPGILILGLLLLWQFIQQGYQLSASTYAAVIVGTGFIILLEKLLTKNKDWKPTRNDYKNEFLYLSIVQILLPQFVTLFVIFSIYEPVQNWLPSLSTLWPHDLPIAVQFIALLLIIDFVRYWVHRLAHTNSLLWRLHAVHHSTQKLFWLNTVRFHPLEKAIQLLFDSIPFILLGVQAEILAFYYVFYALNGFFQHSNIRLNLGWLNYIFSTADLHRWHHSKIPSESNTNYGNNLIIWDILFGTYYLPKDKPLEEFGLLNRNYPLDFSSQLRAPFVKDLDKTSSEVINWKEIFHFQIIKLVIAWIGLRYRRPVLAMTFNPEETQKRVLRDILLSQENTQYGLEHRFHKIENYQDFSRAIPINEYENLRDKFERQSKIGKPVINEDRAIYYSVTSGTTDKAKFIPVSQSDLQRLKLEQALFSFEVYRSCPSAFLGKMLMITSPAIEGHTKEGIPYGSTSGLLSRLTPTLFKNKQVIPDEVFDIKDYASRYFVILCFALLERNITYMGAANPSSLVIINKILNQNKEALIKTTYDSELPVDCGASEPLRRLYRKTAFRSLDRREEIVKMLHDSVSLATLWPNLKLVNTWTGGSCGVALHSLKLMLPANCQVNELGLISSELRVTFPLADRMGGLPNLNHAFFEFVKKEDWEEGKRNFRLLHELDDNQQYYLFFTTHSGLYRYAINDIVEVNGFYHRTPLLKFIQKGQGVTNITGEKIYENQVINAVQSAHARQKEAIPFFVLLADVKNARYQLVIEHVSQSLERIGELARQLDEFLGNLNIEYRAKRQSLRLNPLEVIEAGPGFGEKLKTILVENGQREGQYKPKLLWYKTDFPDSLLTEQV